MTTPPLWDGVLRCLAAQMPAFALKAWLDPLVPEVDGDRLVLRCPTPFHRDRVRDRFLAVIEARASEVARTPVSVRLELAPPSPPDLRLPARTPRRAPEADGRAREQAGAHGDGGSVGDCGRGAAQRTLQYSFDSFVVGPGNALAREASLALARGAQPGVCPLYLASGSGLGKTHLARALAREARAHGTGHTLYVSAEGFTNEFLGSIRSRQMAGFKRRYREQCELLVVEDLQFLAGKQSTQLELFHTLTHLLDAGRRVVLTADREPRELDGLDPRLRSQLAAGLVAVIEPPDARVRRQILRQRAAAGGVRLPDPCLDLLVARARGSVRDLEGVLIQLVTSAALLKRPIDLELTEQALRKVSPIGESASPLRVTDVLAVVAGYFETRPEALASRSRRRDVLVPRQLAMYLCRRYTDEPLARIGEALGRDHPAVSHAIRTVERRILERAPVRYQVEALAQRLDALRDGGGRSGS